MKYEYKKTKNKNLEKIFRKINRSKDAKIFFKTLTKRKVI